MHLKVDIPTPNRSEEMMTAVKKLPEAPDDCYQFGALVGGCLGSLLVQAKWRFPRKATAVSFCLGWSAIATSLDGIGVGWYPNESEGSVIRVGPP